MNRLFLLAGFAALAMMLALIVGCSSTSTGPITRMVGDTTSSVYQTASVVFDTAQSYGVQALSGTFDVATTVYATLSPNHPGSPSAVAPVFHAASKYWYRSRSGTSYTHPFGHPDSILDSIPWLQQDSVQFRNSDSAMMTPDSASLVEVRSGCSFRAHAANGPDSLLASHTFDVTGAPGQIWSKGNVVINSNGSTHADLTKLKHRHDSLTVCDVAVDLNSSWQNINANITMALDSGQCPTSGVINHIGMLNVSCSNGLDSLKFAGAWARTKTFNNGMVTIVYVSPTTQWTVTKTCGSNGGGMLAPIGGTKSDPLAAK